MSKYTSGQNSCPANDNLQTRAGLLACSELRPVTNGTITGVPVGPLAVTERLFQLAYSSFVAARAYGDLNFVQARMFGEAALGILAIGRPVTKTLISVFPHYLMTKPEELREGERIVKACRSAGDWAPAHAAAYDADRPGKLVDIIAVLQPLNDDCPALILGVPDDLDLFAKLFGRSPSRH
jgi:hypothetical protein